MRGESCYLLKTIEDTSSWIENFCSLAPIEIYFIYTILPFFWNIPSLTMKILSSFAIGKSSKMLLGSDGKIFPYEGLDRGRVGWGRFKGSGRDRESKKKLWVIRSNLVRIFWVEFTKLRGGWFLNQVFKPKRKLWDSLLQTCRDSSSLLSSCVLSPCNSTLFFHGFVYPWVLSSLKVWGCELLWDLVEAIKVLAMAELEFSGS